MREEGRVGVRVREGRGKGQGGLECGVTQGNEVGLGCGAHRDLSRTRASLLRQVIEDGGNALNPRP